MIERMVSTRCSLYGKTDSATEYKFCKSTKNFCSIRQYFVVPSTQNKKSQISDPAKARRNQHKRDFWIGKTTSISVILICTLLNVTSCASPSNGILASADESPLCKPQTLIELTKQIRDGSNLSSITTIEKYTHVKFFEYNTNYRNNIISRNWKVNILQKESCFSDVYYTSQSFDPFYPPTEPYNHEKFHLTIRGLKGDSCVAWGLINSSINAPFQGTPFGPGLSELWIVDPSRKDVPVIAFGPYDDGHTLCASGVTIIQYYK